MKLCECSFEAPIQVPLPGLKMGETEEENFGMWCFKFYEGHFNLHPYSSHSLKFWTDSSLVTFDDLVGFCRLYKMHNEYLTNNMKYDSVHLFQPNNEDQSCSYFNSCYIMDQNVLSCCWGREIMMGEGNIQPPLCVCWLPLWVVELGLVAESCQHNSSTP